MEGSGGLINEDEARSMAEGIDSFMELLSEEKERLNQEEVALLASIEWEIRLRSREASLTDPTCTAARFEEWLDDDQISPHWLLNYSEKLLSEEARSQETRRLSQDCAEFLWKAYREACEEEISRDMFRDWYLIWKSFEPITPGLDLGTVRASIKRMLFAHRLASKQTEPGNEFRRRRSQRWYGELFELYRLVSKYAEEEASGEWDNLEPPLPF